MFWTVVLSLLDDHERPLAPLLACPLAISTVFGGVYLFLTLHDTVSLIEVVFIALLIILPCDVIASRQDDLETSRKSRRLGGSGIGIAVNVAEISAVVVSQATAHQHTDEQAFARWTAILGEQAAQAANEAMRRMTALFPAFVSVALDPLPDSLTGTWVGGVSHEEHTFALFLILLDQSDSLAGFAVFYDGASAAQYNVQGQRNGAEVTLALESAIEHVQMCVLVGKYRREPEKLELSGALVWATNTVPISVLLSRGGPESLAAQFLSPNAS